MLKRMCKNCFEMYEGKPDVCPHCGATLKKEKPNKEEQKREKKEKKKRVSSKEIIDSLDFVALMAKSDKSKRNKKAKEPEFKVQKNGEYSVNVKDVTYLPNTYTYSAKKARGEYDAPKIQWWEIYKWADVLMAKRKIKKQVKNASYYKPEQFSKTKLILLSLFLGWTGAHNFYARNYRKGAFMLFCTIFGSFVALAPYKWINYIRVSIGGGLLFIMLIMWVLDVINIISGTFSFRLSKWKFIDCLNTDCRATLGEKYIDKDEYKKPWYVRMVNSINEKHKENKAKRQARKEQLKQQKLALQEDQTTKIQETTQKHAKEVSQEEDVTQASSISDPDKTTMQDDEVASTSQEDKNTKNNKM